MRPVHTLGTSRRIQAQPTIEPRQQVGWRVRINHYHNLGRTQARLAGLLKAFCFRPLETVLGELESESGLPGFRFG